MADADIDLYADDIDSEFNQEGDYNHDTNVDLYDDVITAPSDDRNDEGRSSSVGSSSPRRHVTNSNKRAAVYVGNLTWWSTDQDLTDAIQDLGVNDVVEIKFYENRANGQSKGFCIVALGSENSLRTLMDKLPKKELHGQNPVVTLCTKQNLNYFEMQSRKGGHGGNRNEGMNDRRNRDRDRDWDVRDYRENNQRGMNQDRSRSRSNPPPHYQQQRMPPGPQMHHPPPQGPPPPQYQQGHPWMSAPPPQIHHMPPPPAQRPGVPPMTAGGPPPPPGLQGPPPPRPGPPPPGNMRLPPPRGPLPPPMGPRNVGVPDTRGPPPVQQDWERHPPPQPVAIATQQMGPPNRPPPPVPAPGQGLPPSIPPPGPHVPSPHINPAFFQHNQGVPPGLVSTSQPSDIYSRPPPVQFSDYRPSNDRGPEPAASSVNESEFEEIMGRNRTVSSSAISRAVADASAGDYASAIETLVTAISLIKQSKVANDERCKILISSLQDTLHGIESKSYGSRSKERARSRERERSRERSSRREKSSRRDRSRSRDREYRDRSRERDRYHEDRYRDKDRDHDRDRRSSRH